MKVRALGSRMILMIGLILTCGYAYTDWEHWRGPQHNGTSAERGLVDSWTLEGENVLWESPIGGRATPIILGDRVYLNCRTKVDPRDPADAINAREQVVCLDLGSGEVIWRDQFNVAQTDIAAERVGWASMAGDTETGNVYMHSVSGLLRCYSSSGQRLWEHQLAEAFGKISGFGGRTQAPIIDEDRVVVSFLAANWGQTAGPAPKHYYYAFDKHNGQLQWVSAPGGRPYDTNYSGAIVTTLGGQRLLIGGNSDGGIYAMQARTGNPVWGFQMSKRGLNATPVVHESRVYISHGEDNIDSLEFGRVQCLDLATGAGGVADSGLWRLDGVKAGYAGLLVRGSILYVVTDSGELVAIDAETGEPLWSHHLGTIGRGSPVWADGKLYVTEVHGNVYILRPSRTGCQTLSHVSIPAAAGDTFDEIFASPAIFDGKVIIVTRDRTLCLYDQSKQGQTRQQSSASIAPVIEDERVATAQLVPAESILVGEQTQEYRLRLFNRDGQLVREEKPILQASDVPSTIRVSDATVSTLGQREHHTLTVSASAGEISAHARLRALPELPWTWDFEDRVVPETWVRAQGKLHPVELLPAAGAGNGLMARPGRGRPSLTVWLGDPKMRGYEIRTDVMMSEQRRRLSNIGVVCERYNLTLKGNTGRLEIQSWAPQMRMAREVPFQVNPDVWYSLSLWVEQTDAGTIVHGKAWPRDQPEPTEDTITAKDPHAMSGGSPGLYTYTLADCFYDNVSIRKIAND